MKKAKRNKFSKRVSGGELARAATPNLKKRPRGRAFAKNNSYGLATRWKKGTSGNPNGRTSEQQKIGSLISKALCARLPQIGGKALLQSPSRTYTEKLADEWIAQGLAGNVGAIVTIAERLEGKAATSVTVDQGQDAIAILVASMDDRSDEIGLAEGRQRQLTAGADENGQEETIG